MIWRKAAAVVSICGLLGGCALHVSPYRCLPGEDGAGTDPRKLWACNRDVMVRAATGRKYAMGEFAEAAEFLERITSIPADTITTPLGPVPGESLRDSLERWDEWCRENCDRLRWDADAGRVVVAEEAVSAA
jgi:hypothetical protein